MNLSKNTWKFGHVKIHTPVKESRRPHGPTVDVAFCYAVGLQSLLVSQNAHSQSSSPCLWGLSLLSRSFARQVWCALLCLCLLGAGDPEVNESTSQPQEPIKGGLQRWASQVWAELRDEPGGKIPSAEKLGRNPLSPEGEGFDRRGCRADKLFRAERTTETEKQFYLPWKSISGQ